MEKKIEGMEVAKDLHLLLTLELYFHEIEF